jgi:hypothetical protein
MPQDCGRASRGTVDSLSGLVRARTVGWPASSRTRTTTVETVLEGKAAADGTVPPVMYSPPFSPTAALPQPSNAPPNGQ